jgi:hypothetical protein
MSQTKRMIPSPASQILAHNFSNKYGNNMAQQIIISTDKDRVTVAPGAKTELNVTIQNLTTLVDDVSVSAAGIDQSWVQVVPSHVPVFAQGTASVRVIFGPPPDMVKTLAGLYPVKIIATLQEQASQPEETAVELEVQFSGDYRIELGKGTPSSNQEAIFPFKVHNDANAPLNLQCSGEDPQDAFWYKFDPFQFTVPPGGEATSTLSIRTRQAASGGQQVSFTLKTQGEWPITGMSSITAAAKQVSGLWESGVMPGLSVAINPAQVAGSGSGEYQVAVGNPGLAPETVTLEVGTTGNQVGYRFDRPQVSLNPQSQAISTLTVWPITPMNTPGEAVFLFWVTATAVSGKVKPGTARATFTNIVPEPVRQRPSWIIPIILGIIILVSLCMIGYFLYYWFSTPPQQPLGSVSFSQLISRFFARSIFDGSIRFYFS